MRVLIVEDDANKMKALSDFLGEYPVVDIVTRMSYHSSILTLLKEPFDLVLLDMTIPLYDITPRDTGGRPLPLGGRDILFTISRKKIQTKVIVVTQYESFEGTSLSQLEHDLRDSFPNLYCGSVYYKTTQNLWKEQLNKILEVHFKFKGGNL